MSLLPVTVLSGFLGAGKTTVLNHILNSNHGLKVAVIVNDMSEVNIDAVLIDKQQTSVSRTEASLVEMSNGCICCTLREDLLVEVRRLALEGKFDYLLIESTGISEPLPVAETFTFTDEHGLSLGSIARLDTLVTVVDAFNFLIEYENSQDLLERGLALDESDDRNIVDLLIDQIEFANVILVNKIDLVSSKELGVLKNIINKINPDARIHEISKGKLDPSLILNTKLFDFDLAAENPGWMQEIRGNKTSETDEYGIKSFVFSAREAFDPEKLFDFVHNAWQYGILRAKGFIWLATRPDEACLFSLASRSCQVVPNGFWLASSESDLAKLSQDIKAEVELIWHPFYGDRLQEVVIIGQNMDEDKIRHALETSLLPPLKSPVFPETWKSLSDPFPAWN